MRNRERMRKKERERERERVGGRGWGWNREPNRQTANQPDRAMSHLNSDSKTA